mgnify:CR=1 FL=1
MKQLQTHKKDLNKARVISKQIDNDIGPDEVLLRIEKFSFTANNVTYGVAGDTIGYWKFFPAIENSDNSWGCIPVWGFAEVIRIVFSISVRIGSIGFSLCFFGIVA